MSSASQDARADAVYRSVPPTSIAVVLLTAALVLAGWLLGNEHLKRIMPGLVAMNPLTAVSLACAAVALGLALGGRAPVLRLALAAVPVIAGLTKLFDLFGGTDLGFDQLMFREDLGVGSATPNRRPTPRCAWRSAASR